MAEKDTALTSSRETRSPGIGRHSGWGVSPFRALQQLSDEMDRMFDDFGFNRGWRSPLSGRSALGMWAPDVEVYQRNNELTIKADLPGLKRDEISVDITDDAVIIEGERKREHDEEREGIYRSERSYGSFRRVIPIPEGAITEQAKANFRDGVLQITLPAPPASKGRRLEIGEDVKK
jgi:HSP20 family protein